MTYFELAHCLWDFCPLLLQVCFQDALRGQLVPSLPWPLCPAHRWDRWKPLWCIPALTCWAVSDIALEQLGIPLEYNTAVRPVCAQPHRDITFLLPLRCLWMGESLKKVSLPVLCVCLLWPELTFPSHILFFFPDLTSNLFPKQMEVELGGCIRHKCLYLRMKSVREMTTSGSQTEYNLWTDTFLSKKQLLLKMPTSPTLGWDNAVS